MALRHRPKRRTQDRPSHLRRIVSVREECRRWAYRWFQREVPKSEIARRLDVSWQTVNAWSKRRLSQGPNSWRKKRHPGRPPKLSGKQTRRLRDFLLEGALAHGYATDLWTIKRVAGVTEKEFGEEYTQSGVWRVPCDLGISAQVPIPHAVERDEAYSWHGKETEWPKIQTKARRTRATLLFLDEGFVQSEPNVRRTWWIAGKRPEIQVRQGKRMKLSLISAVGVKGQLYFRISKMNENFDGDGILEFLRYLLMEVYGRILLLYDDGTLHRCKDVKAFLWEARERLETRRFPAYAPELNPDKLVWSALKYQRLPNFCPKTEEEMREGVERELRWLPRHPDFVAGCTQHAEIPLGK